MADQDDITALLERCSRGDARAVDRLFPHVYGALRAMARKRLLAERRDHTLNATALVHEAYLKLIDQRSASWQNRAHFFAIAAQAMRRILVNHAEARLAKKRGGGQTRVTLNDDLIGAVHRAEELLALDEALERLRNLSERQARVVEYHFFTGLSHEEVAEVLGVSLPTVRRDWRLARAWLSRELRDGA